MCEAICRPQNAVWLNKLKIKYVDEGDERCGFVLKDGSIVESLNQAEETSFAFKISCDFIRQYEDQTYASWHTHPGENSNLSCEDYRAFMNYPEWDHFIIGNDGVRRFFIEDGYLLQNVPN